MLHQKPITAAAASSLSPMYLVVGVKVRVDDSRVWVRLRVHYAIVDVRLGVDDNIVHVAFCCVSAGAAEISRGSLSYVPGTGLARTLMAAAMRIRIADFMMMVDRFSLWLWSGSRIVEESR